VAIPFSILDLAPIVEAGTAADALQQSLDFARHAERCGYHRYWLAEHHNMPGIASSATAVLIAYIAGGTRTIRLGSGGIMLPNHAPLIVAEQFGTLETLYPGRIDLGLGRAPGTDMLTSRALRRNLETNADAFAEDVHELQHFFEAAGPRQAVRAIPGVGLKIPLFILGSSLFGASVAAMFGLSFAFASHFAPDALKAALDLYRARFKPSRQLERPYVMVAANVVVAEREAEARRLFTSLQQMSLQTLRGSPVALPQPVDNLKLLASTAEIEAIDHMFMHSFVGTPETVTSGLKSFLKMTRADELIVSNPIFDHTARLRSLELTAKIRDSDEFRA
jgi:luciferase family oxidoreductase group 1